MSLIVLTRERPHNDDLIRGIGDLADVLEVPVTTTVLFDPADIERRRDELDLSHFATLVVTSSRALSALELVRPVLDSNVSVAVVGELTANLVASSFSPVDLVASSASELASRIEAGPVLHVGAARPRHELAEGLAARGIAHRHLATYDTVPAVLTETQRQTLAHADVVVMAAPSAWDVAREYVESTSVVIAIGATTAEHVARDHEVINAEGDVLGAIRDVMVALKNNEG